MTRVLILIKGLGAGGAERLLARSMAVADHDRFEYKIAYLLPSKDALAPAIRSHGIETVCLDGGRGMGWARALARLVRAHDTDIVHSHSPYPAAIARTVVRDPAHVYTEHNVWEQYRKPTYWANALTFRRNAHVFAVSDQVLRSIRPPGSRRRPATETLYQGIDPEWFERSVDRAEAKERLGIPAGDPVVGSVANFRKDKAHEVLLEAMVEVQASFPRAHLVLAGQGPLEDRVRRAAAELRVEHVVFTGMVEDVAPVVSSFDVLASSSDHEGLPMSMLEAMALGRPVASTRAGGVPELVENGTHGILVDRRDPSGLARAIASLLSDPGTAARMGAAGRKRAREFDIRRTVARTEQVYRRLTT